MQEMKKIKENKEINEMKEEKKKNTIMNINTFPAIEELCRN